MSLEKFDFLAGVGVPEFDVVFAVSGNDTFAIGAEGYGVDVVFVLGVDGAQLSPSTSEAISPRVGQPTG